MGLGDSLKKLGNYLSAEGWVAGHSFPAGSYLHFSKDEGDSAIRITYPKDAGEFVITHDMVKYAACIALGPIGLRSNSNGGNTVIYGAKYRFELNDGKSGVITCNTDKATTIEQILF